jgi:hypothetical protein
MRLDRNQKLSRLKGQWSIKAQHPRLHPADPQTTEPQFAVQPMREQGLLLAASLISEVQKKSLFDPLMQGGYLSCYLYRLTYDCFLSSSSALFGNRSFDMLLPLLVKRLKTAVVEELYYSESSFEPILEIVLFIKFAINLVVSRRRSDQFLTYGTCRSIFNELRNFLLSSVFSCTYT